MSGLNPRSRKDMNKQVDCVLNYICSSRKDEKTYKMNQEMVRHKRKGRVQGCRCGQITKTSMLNSLIKYETNWIIEYE